MPWTSLSVYDALTEFNSAEKAQIDTQTGAAGNFAIILARVVAELRGDIRAGNFALDSNPALIPDALHASVIHIARWRFLNSLPLGKELLNAERRQAHDLALEKFRLIAAGKHQVEAPYNATAPAANWNAENKILGRLHPVPRPGAESGSTTAPYANPNGPADQGL